LHEETIQFLLAQFELEEVDLYRVNGPVNLVRMMNVADQVARPDLKYAPFVPGLPKTLNKVLKGRDVFDVLKKQDILLHHPFQSFMPVIQFIQQAPRIRWWWRSSRRSIAPAPTPSSWKR